MDIATESRRRSPRERKRASAQVRVVLDNPDRRELRGTLVDLSEWGVGVETREPLEVGCQVTVTGQFFSTKSALGAAHKGRVVHCRSFDDGRYRSGLAFEEPERQDQHSHRPPPAADSSFVDHYETLQISPNADLETIQRVYRLLAQRFHPDNLETGNQEAFRVVLQAFHVLSHPEKRASYDVQYRASRALRWKIFDQPTAARGSEAEKRTRFGILSILHTKRLEEPAKPGVSLRDLEALLGCPREHLEFSLWYLKTKALVSAEDNGRYVITADGVDACERSSPLDADSHHALLPEPQLS